MNPYYVNVSAINDFANCRFRWWARWVMNWVPREESPALRFGTLLHEVFESHFIGASMKEAIELCNEDWRKAALTTIDPYERDSRLNALTKLQEFTEPLLLWKDQYTFEATVEVEEPFEFKLEQYDTSQLILRGRPDRVSIRDGMIWHVQTKGLAPSTNFGVFIDLAKRSYHEHLYAEALYEKYCQSYHNLKYGGTMFNLIRKLKYRTGVTKKKPEGDVKSLSEMFYQHPMTIDLNSNLHRHVMSCIKNYAYEMQQAEKDYYTMDIIPTPNEKMNGGYFGNSPDPYFRVLVGEIELGDLNYFKKREDTYAPTGGDED